MIKGYNQSQIIAEQLAASLHIEHKTLLTKTKYTTSQTKLNRNQRLMNLQTAFRLDQDIDLQNTKLIIIADDITTTGSTIQEIAKLIKLAHPHITVR